MTRLFSTEGFRNYHWRMILTLMLVWLLNSTFQMLYPILSPSIMKDWDLTYINIGSIRSLTQIGKAIGVLFFGALADYLGRKKCLLMMVPISSIIISLVGLSGDWFQLAIALTAFSFMSSGIFPVVFTLASEELTPKRRGFGVSVIASGYALGGGILASTLTARFVSISWRIPFFCGIVSAPIVALAIKNLPESQIWLTLRDEGEHMEGMSWRKKVTSFKPLRMWNKKYLRDIFSILVVRVISLVLWVGVTQWITMFLVVERGLPMAAGAIWFTLFGITGFFGNWFNGLCADKLGRRKTIPLFFSIVGFLILIFTMYTRSELEAYLMTGPIGFMLLGLYPTTFTFASEMLPSKARASGMALISLLIQPLSIALPSIIGTVSTAYSIALCFNVIAVLTIIGAVFLFFIIPETKAKVFDTRT